MKLEKQKIKPVVKIVCPKCGELQLKIYPWSSYNIDVRGAVIPCNKCLNQAIGKQ